MWFEFAIGLGFHDVFEAHILIYTNARIEIAKINPKGRFL